MSTHLVDRHIFDVRYDSEADAIPLQNKILGITHDKLFDVISSVFDEFDSPKNIRFNTLELDLGSIQESNLEEELLASVEDALRKLLIQKLGAPTNKPNAAENDPKDSEKQQTAIFEQFMVSGTIPWWVRNRNDFDIKAHIASALKNQLPAVVQIIQANAQKSYFLERVVVNLDQSQLNTVVRLLEPAEATLILETADSLIASHQSKPVVQADTRSYRNKIWEFILTYLLIDRGSVFNQKMFVSSILERMAHHFNVNYDDFLQHFYDSFKDLKKQRSIPHGLNAIIEEIYWERKQVAPQKSKQKKTPSTEIKSLYSQLIADHPSFDSKFEHDLIVLIQSKSEAFVSFLNRESKNPNLHRNFARSLSEKSLLLLVGLIEPGGKNVIFQFSKNIQRIKENGSVKIAGNDADLHVSKWEIILRALLVDRGSQFNLKSFVRASLHQLAQRFGLDVHVLIHFALADLDVAYPSAAQGDLAKVLLEIRDEETEKIQEQDAREYAAFEQKVRIQWIEYALDHSKFPLWSQKHQLAPEDFQQVLFELLERVPGDMKSLLYVQLKSNRKRLFLIRHLNEKGRERIVRFMEPKAVEKIELYLTVLDKINEHEKVSGNKLEFSRYKWNTILEVLTTDKESFFNYKSFLLRSLHQLSNHFNISFATLFSYILELSESIPEFRQNQFKLAIESIQADFQAQEKFAFKPKEELPETAEQVWKNLGNIGNSASGELRVLFVFLFKMKKDTYFRNSIDLMAWIEQHPEISKSDFMSIVSALNFNQKELIRIFSQQKTASRTKMLAFLVDSDSLFVPYYLKDLNHLIAHSFSEGHRLQHQSLLFALSFMLRNPHFDKHYFFYKLNEYLSNFEGIRSDEMVTKLQNAVKTQAENLNSTLALSLKKLMHSETNEKTFKKAQKDSNEKNKATKEKSTEKEVLDEKEILKKLEEEEESDQENLYVTNSGLVLLWPFLSQYFTMLGLLEKDEFTSISASIRGVHLLQFLCSGSEEHAEHELVLNKILCGLPITLPIDSSFEISPKEKELSESMLLGVLQNWARMKESSIEALRETFLIRSGIVAFEEETIDLRVEKKTVDVLLEGMPWSFTIIKLPWMKKPIRTVWN